MPRRRSRVELLSEATKNPLAAGEEQPQPAAKPRQVLDDRFSVMYKELHRLAAAVKGDDMHATISTSTLVHEAWMKLARSSGLAPQSELHFKSTFRFCFCSAEWRYVLDLRFIHRQQQQRRRRFEHLRFSGHL